MILAIYHVVLVNLAPRDAASEELSINQKERQLI